MHSYYQAKDAFFNFYPIKLHLPVRKNESVQFKNCLKSNRMFDVLCDYK